jgi:hypothetical protein
LKAVAAWHQQITNDEFRAMLTRQEQTDFTIFSLENLPPKRFQQLRKKYTSGRFILNQQNGFHRMAAYGF